jgi:hypothetical protein
LVVCCLSSQHLFQQFVQYCPACRASSDLRNRPFFDLFGCTGTHENRGFCRGLGRIAFIAAWLPPHDFAFGADDPFCLGSEHLAGLQIFYGLGCQRQRRT